MSGGLVSTAMLSYFCFTMYLLLRPRSREMSLDMNELSDAVVEAVIAILSDEGYCKLKKLVNSDVYRSQNYCHNTR